MFFKELLWVFYVWCGRGIFVRTRMRVCEQGLCLPLMLLLANFLVLVTVGSLSNFVIDAPDSRGICKGLIESRLREMFSFVIPCLF